MKVINAIKNFIEGLLFENDEVSLTRMIALMGYVLFAGVSIYLIATHTNWDNYATFASYTGGGGAAVQLVNKAINSKWNSKPGSYNPASDSTTAPSETIAKKDDEPAVVPSTRGEKK